MRRSLRVEWHWLLAAWTLVLLFIPPRRYQLPVGLPFELDPNRLLTMLLVALFLLSLLADERVRLRASGLEAPLALFALGVLGSELANPSRVSLYQGNVVKTLAVLFGAIIAFYLTVNFVTSRRAVETTLTVLVLGGSVLAVLALLEANSGWTPFAHLDRYVPFLSPSEAENFSDAFRGGRLRALSSSEHPIAFGALLAMLVPIAAAVALRRKTPLWWLSLLVLAVGSVATISRTPVLMIVAAGFMFACLRPRESARFAPAVICVIAATHFAMPGALGALRVAFDPNLLVVEGSQLPQSQYAGGRLTDLTPSIEEVKAKPLLGSGVGTRIVVGDTANARILDNQWLGSLLEMGVIGVAGLVWFFARAIRRLIRAARRVPDDDSILLAGVAAAIVAYTVGMFTYDAFSFPQTEFAFFVIVGVGSALVLARDPILGVDGLAVADEATPPRVRRESLQPG